VPLLRLRLGIPFAGAVGADDFDDDDAEVDDVDGDDADAGVVVLAEVEVRAGEDDAAVTVAVAVFTAVTTTVVSAEASEEEAAPAGDRPIGRSLVTADVAVTVPVSTRVELSVAPPSGGHRWRI
jgi:hypothetical protein